jgi:hypothetical protein
VGSTWSVEDRDAVRARVRAIASWPGVVVDEANAHAGFSVRGKRFAWLLVDHHDDGRLALCVKAPPGEQEALLGAGGCYFTPAYLGSKGWVGIDVDPQAAPDWDDVTMLLEQAWRMVAPARLVARLEQPHPQQHE